MEGAIRKLVFKTWVAPLTAPLQGFFVGLFPLGPSTGLETCPFAAVCQTAMEAVHAVHAWAWFDTYRISSWHAYLYWQLASAWGEGTLSRCRAYPVYGGCYAQGSRCSRLGHVLPARNPEVHGRAMCRRAAGLARYLHSAHHEPASLAPWPGIMAQRFLRLSPNLELRGKMEDVKVGFCPATCLDLSGISM